MSFSFKLRYLYRAWRYRLKLDPAEIKAILVNLAPGDVAIDIGAHKGAYTYWLQKRVSDSGRVVAFEPQVALSDYLKKVVSILGWRNVRIENMGLSSQQGELSLFVPGGAPSPGATFESRGHDSAEGETRTVKVETLDHYISEAGIEGRVGFIKCDVEGHELEVFKGAEQTIESDAPLILFECESRHHHGSTIQDVFDWLLERGYKGYFFYRKELRPLKDFNEAIHQVVGGGDYANNFLFSKSSIH